MSIPLWRRKMLGPIFDSKAPCPVRGIKFSYPRINGRNGKSGREIQAEQAKPNYTIEGIRALLCAILLRAMSDAKAEDITLHDEAREFLCEGAGWITHHLYGLELDGKTLITLIDAGHLDDHLRMKVQRYRRTVHRIDRPDLEEIRLKPLPPELNAGLLYGGEKP